MNLLDVALISLIIWQIIRGVKTGLVRQSISLLSLFIAFVIASFVSPFIISRLGSSISKPLAAIIIFFIILFAITLVAELMSKKLTSLVHRSQKIDKMNQIAGGVLGLALAIVAIWLLTAIFSSTVWLKLSAQITDSKVVRVIDETMPPPPGFIAGIQKYLSNLSFPKVFVGLEPRLDKPVNLPPEADIRTVALRAQNSVVKIVGPGCGNYLSDGSGFVADNNLVVTNAHVVAGIERPQVVDTEGTHASRVVYFDPNIDLAILRTNNLNSSPLPINYNDMSRAEAGAVLGYPGGGGFSAVSAVVIDKIIAYGRNIYGQGEVHRPVYALRTRVVPGNSGGPLLNLRGEVTGVIFASSQTDDDVGYALTSQVLREPLAQSKTKPSAVSSGKCLMH